MDFKDKKIISSVIIILILVGLASLNFYKKPKIYEDMESFYSSLTDYMKDYVNTRLDYLKCEPKKYYDNDSQICFLCDDYQVCFGYAWIERMGEQKRNPQQSSFIKEVNRLEVGFADFCYKGLASELGCKKGDDSSRLECGQVNFVNNSQGNKVDCEKMQIKIREESNFQDFVKMFCESKGEEITKVTDLFVVCGKVEGCHEDLDFFCGQEDCSKEEIDLLLECAKYLISGEGEEVRIFSTI